jgi:hypothetical protein
LCIGVYSVMTEDAVPKCQQKYWNYIGITWQYYKIDHCQIWE